MAAAAAMADESVAQLAELYLGNILYAIELAALALEGQGRPEDAAFYRGIARKLADAHGKARPAGSGQSAAEAASESSAPRGAY
jgi:hypothetical protein